MRKTTLPPVLVKPLTHGVRRDLDDAATEILISSVHPDASAVVRRNFWGKTMNVLSDYQWRVRLSREVYTPLGTPHPHVRLGMVHRKANRVSAHLNSREGIAQFSSRRDPAIGSVIQWHYDTYGTYASGVHDPYMAAMTMTVEEDEDNPRYEHGSPSREYTQPSWLVRQRRR